MRERREVLRLEGTVDIEIELNLSREADQEHQLFHRVMLQCSENAVGRILEKPNRWSDFRGHHKPVD